MFKDCQDWKTVKDYNRYQVHWNGRVRNKFTKRVLDIQNGWRVVLTSDEGKRSSRSIKKLINTHFVNKGVF